MPRVLRFKSGALKLATEFARSRSASRNDGASLATLDTLACRPSPGPAPPPPTVAESAPSTLAAKARRASCLDSIAAILLFTDASTTGRVRGGGVGAGPRAEGRGARRSRWEVGKAEREEEAERSDESDLVECSARGERGAAWA